MKRPIQHEIGTVVKLVFQKSLPPSWIARPMQPDYGLDYEVEIVEKEKPTGKVFGVQLKGTRSPKYEDESLRLSFEVDKLIYYFKDICKPVFIVLADLKNNECFWLFAQRYIQQILSKQNPHWYEQKSVTLHIPKSNQLLGSVQSLQRAVEEGLQKVFILQVGRIVPEGDIDEFKASETVKRAYLGG